MPSQVETEACPSCRNHFLHGHDCSLGKAGTSVFGRVKPIRRVFTLAPIMENG